MFAEVEEVGSSTESFVIIVLIELVSRMGIGTTLCRIDCARGKSLADTFCGTNVFGKLSVGQVNVPRIGGGMLSSEGLNGNVSSCGTAVASG